MKPPVFIYFQHITLEVSRLCLHSGFLSLGIYYTGGHNCVPVHNKKSVFLLMFIFKILQPEFLMSFFNIWLVVLTLFS